MPVEEALQLGQEKGYSGFLVAEDGRLLDVVTGYSLLVTRCWLLVASNLNKYKK